MNSLDDPVDDVRLQAMLAIEAMLPQPLTDEQARPLFASLEEHAHDAVEQVRQVALTILGRQYTDVSTRAQACSVLALGLHDESPRVQQAAVEALVQMGETLPYLRSSPCSAPAIHASASWRSSSPRK